MATASVSVETLKSKAVQTRGLSPRSRHPKTEKQAVDPAQSPGKRILARRRRSKGRDTSVADAALRLFLKANAASQRAPQDFDLRLYQRGGYVTGGYWHKPSGKFVASWFHPFATANGGWIIAYLPPTCENIEAEHVPFGEVARVPSVLRKAGCRIGSARLLRQMMSALVPL